MKRVVILIITVLFLTSFITSQGITASAISNNSGNPNNSNIQNNELNQKQNLTQAQVENIVQSRNRIRTQLNGSECPNNCSCDGSTTKCQFENGREMTIQAGQSGNTIIQSKKINASTNVELYKSENKIYGIFKDNQTKELNIFPDELQKKIREKIQTRLENQTLKLDENGIYQMRAEKRARLFGIFPVKATIQAEINSETGEIIRIKNPWWGFLAQDETEKE
jgi:hypothetical protein